MAKWAFFNGKYLHAHAINYSVAGLEETEGEDSALLSYQGYRDKIQKYIESLPDGKLSPGFIQEIKAEIAAVLSELATDNFKEAALNDTLNDLQKEFSNFSKVSTQYLSEISRHGDVVLSDDVLVSDFRHKLDDSIKEYRAYDKLIQFGKDVQKEIKRLTNPKNPNHLVETTDMLLVRKEFEAMLKEFQKLSNSDPVLKKSKRLTQKYKGQLTRYVQAVNKVMEAYKNAPRPKMLGAIGEFATKIAINRALERAMKDKIYPEFSKAIDAVAKHTGNEQDIVSIKVPDYLEGKDVEAFLKAMNVKIDKNSGNFVQTVNTGDGSLRYEIATSEAKADVTLNISWDDGTSLLSGFSVKNYSLGNEGRWMQVTSGNPFGTMVSEGETYLDDFFAHYFNLTVSHKHTEELSREDGTKRKRRKHYKFSKELYTDAHMTMKIYLLYQALAGVFGREHNAEYFVVINHSKDVNSDDFISIVSIKEFVLSILREKDKINNRIAVKLGHHSLVGNPQEVYGEMKWVKAENSTAEALREAKAQRIQHFYNALMSMPTDVKVNASIKGLNLIK